MGEIVQFERNKWELLKQAIHSFDLAEINKRYYEMFPDEAVADQSRAALTPVPVVAAPPNEEPDFCVCDYRPRRKCSVHPPVSREPLDTGERWVEAVQGALGNMGRLGDRDYFTFCMWLVIDQAEKDGLIRAETRTQEKVKEFREKTDKLKKILCDAGVSREPISAEQKLSEP